MTAPLQTTTAQALDLMCDECRRRMPPGRLELDWWCWMDVFGRVMMTCGPCTPTWVKLDGETKRCRETETADSTRAATT